MICSGCTAPETECMHWIGLECELDAEEIDFKALERYLIKVCTKGENENGN